MDMAEITNERIMGIVMQHPDGISAADLCDELVRHGWAHDDISPRKFGLADDDIVRLKR